MRMFACHGTLGTIERPHLKIAIGLIGAGSLYCLWRHYSKRENIPKKWQEVGKLSDLMCFPVKSLGVVKMSSMECTLMGLKSGWLRDRNFMVIDENAVFLTARQQPRLLLIHPSVNDDNLILNAPGMETFTLKMSDISEKSVLIVEYRDSPLKSIDCGDEVAKWISKFVLNAESGIRLVHYPENFDEEKKSRMDEVVHVKDTGAYPDWTSYNLINESSIDDLNSRMTNTVTDPQAFRPNFVVKGPQPLEEDHWQWVKIGDVVFKVVKNCTRCILTTIDWKTSIKNPDGEPIKTLKTYREISTESYDKGKPIMGIHLALRKAGSVQLGDSVYIA